MKKLEIPQIFDLGLCPFCGKESLKVTRTRKPYRYYECRSCLNTFDGVLVFRAFQDSLFQAAELDRAKTEIARYGL
jgi:predicted RNA-binding Zn-ribbon protein involved in translation (DUF1610 family)